MDNNNYDNNNLNYLMLFNKIITGSSKLPGIQEYEEYKNIFIMEDMTNIIRTCVSLLTPYEKCAICLYFNLDIVIPDRIAKNKKKST